MRRGTSHEMIRRKHLQVAVRPHPQVRRLMLLAVTLCHFEPQLRHVLAHTALLCDALHPNCQCWAVLRACLALRFFSYRRQYGMFKNFLFSLSLPTCICIIGLTPLSMS